MGAKPPALSPSRVEKPVAASLLLPGVEHQVAVLVRQRHRSRASHAGLQVLDRQAAELDLLQEGVDDRLDRHDRPVQPLPAGEVLGVGDGVVGRPLAGHPDHVHPVGAEGVAGDRRDERRVDPARQTQHHRAEAVLDVVAHGGDQRPPHLGLVLERDGDAGHDRLVRRQRCARQHHAVDRHARAVAGVDRAGAVVARRCQVEVDDHEALLPQRRPGEDGAVGADHQRVAVEDELVLPADAVHVDERRTGLRGPPRRERSAQVVLAALVGRAVDAHDEADGRLPGHPHRPALLPQVLADDGRDVDAVQAHDRQPVAPDEVAELVEDAVVRQVVLGVARHHAAAVQHGGAVLRLAGGRPSTSRPGTADGVSLRPQ